jgi:hypothetical protein
MSIQLLLIISLSYNTESRKCNIFGCELHKLIYAILSYTFIGNNLSVVITAKAMLNLWL